MADRNLWVTPVGWDDIGAVLQQLGEGYQYTPVDWDFAGELGKLRAGDVLFINCSASCSSYAPQAADALQKFVSRGGVVYASDYAGHFLESAFSKYLQCDQNGQSGVVTASVVDPGLAEMIGPQITLQFDMGAWWQINKTHRDVRVHLQSSHPLLVSFRYGKGYVLYTSFHNHAQPSEVEERLLRFLVFRPLLASTAENAAQQLIAKAFSPGKEMYEALDPGGPPRRFQIHLDTPSTMLCLLSWQGQARLGLRLENPQGQGVKELTSATSPIAIETYAPSAGTYTATVSALQVPYQNFPFVCTVGTSAKGMQTSTKAVPRIQPSKGPAPYPDKLYSQQWGSTHPGCLIVLLDQSGSMEETFAGQQAGAGRRKCDIVATVLNNLLNEFVRTNTVGAEIKPRADIAVLGYEGESVMSALGGKLAKKDFVTLPELIGSPLRVETREKSEVDDAGQMIKIPIMFPIWVEPRFGSTTPMCAALAHAGGLAAGWAKAHPENYPPVVINITDGASTDGDPAEYARDLCHINTRYGETLLFNCHITNLPQPMIEFPSTPDQVPPDPEGLGAQLFALSSVIPDPARRAILSSTGTSIPGGARGFIFNGDVTAIRQMFVFATIAGTMAALDPNR